MTYGRAYDPNNVVMHYGELERSFCSGKKNVNDVALLFESIKLILLENVTYFTVLPIIK